ncbi:CehA/McbA family metallohydrolase [Paenibacillus filicis]|uniref:CehA/McbA family metallohydrolase n=1 Tax=Paenibacillus gyeongsangnamensis TaxID=3388067 RepID=A0ABT4Q5K5_9BACL|nr:CehA/McbA family metallohydrolase [Paenibacillus filicis]MCZ8512145.1 CehA/McbA family metallohydrolase [Paenibacillus filicis]
MVQINLANKGNEHSRYEVVRDEISNPAEVAEVTAEILDGSAELSTPKTLPARVVVTASDGSHPDGSGDGVYADGRFFVDGNFSITVPEGTIDILIKNGPDYIPLQFSLDVSKGQTLFIRAYLARWFSPEARGWYCGDNHVHSQHDRVAKMKTGLEYTALQGRANGLNFITEAGSHVSYDNMDQLSTGNFLLKYARELRMHCFAGHVNTPGISKDIDDDRMAVIRKNPLATQAIMEAVHEQGGLVVYTHPLSPAHQLHWMGATAVYSDAVLGRCADAFDIDSKATELLWFTVLNLGNKLACSSYTDSALERKHTLTPGDRRIYCHASDFSYSAIIDAMKKGHTFATNGGPVFTFFTIDDSEPGDSIQFDEGDSFTARIEIQSLYPLKKAELYSRGNVVQSFDISGQAGKVNLIYPFQETGENWYVFRAEDVLGNWCITSPIYMELKSGSIHSSSSSVLLEISNHTRFIHLCKDFFAHMLITVSPDDSIIEVELLKDEHTVRNFKPEAGNELAAGKIPVTELELGGEYGPGWIWYPEAACKVHFQADYPVTESGWYSVRVKTAGGEIIHSDAIYFDRTNPLSHEMSVGRLTGKDTEFRIWGYGEEMPLAEIQEPYEDRWWYPKNAAWRIMTTFGEQNYEMHGGQYLPSQTSAQVDPKLLSLFKRL